MGRTPPREVDMVPSAIRRDPNVPLRTRTLPNGCVVVENAYEGTLHIGKTPVAQIKGLSVTGLDGRVVRTAGTTEAGA